MVGDWDRDGDGEGDGYDVRFIYCGRVGGLLGCGVVCRGGWLCVVCGGFTLMMMMKAGFVGGCMCERLCA